TEDTVRLAALAAALADAAANRAAARVQGRLPSGWRNVPSQPQRKAYDGVAVAYALGRDGLTAEDHPGVALVSAAPDAVVLDVAEVHHRFAVAAHPGLVCVDSTLGPVTLRPLPRFPEPGSEVAAGSLLAPMPGSVVEVCVAEGAVVRAGQVVLVLEAMKMRHPVTAPAGGVVRSLAAAVGEQVDAGSVLAVVTEEAG
ncbi:MAG TPA: biotin/lipoyl-containing protein, partial [Pseudonocardiaceae bacterium]